MINGLTNGYLEKICNRILSNIFIGVFPCDVHPIIKNNTFSIIFNTGKSNTNGEHFVAIFVNKNSVYYFDSFGEKCSNNNILKFINKNKKKRKIFYNPIKIQDDLSNFCGFFCLAYLLSKDINYTQQKFINLFNLKCLNNNNKTIVNFIVKNVY